MHTNLKTSDWWSPETTNTLRGSYRRGKARYITFVRLLLRKTESPSLNRANPISPPCSPRHTASWSQAPLLCPRVLSARVCVVQGRFRAGAGLQAAVRPLAPPHATPLLSDWPGGRTSLEMAIGICPIVTGLLIHLALRIPVAK